MSSSAYSSKLISCFGFYFLNQFMSTARIQFIFPGHIQLRRKNWSQVWSHFRISSLIALHFLKLISFFLQWKLKRKSHTLFQSQVNNSNWAVSRKASIEVIVILNLISGPLFSHFSGPAGSLWRWVLLWSLWKLIFSNIFNFDNFIFAKQLQSLLEFQVSIQFNSIQFTIVSY